jgi:hypothetical protein
MSYYRFLDRQDIPYICSQSKYVSSVYQGMQPGGQLTTTNEVETGLESWGNNWSRNDGALQAQAQRFGTDVRDGLLK